MKKTVVRYGDPGSHKIMADLITTHGQRFPSGHILCSLSGCDGWVRHKSKYCIKHMERMKRNGHPTAKPIRFNRNETHMRYVKAGLWVVQRTPGGKEEIQRVLEFIKKKLDESYTKLPKNPYDSRGWTKEEAIAVFYCNLAEHGVTPEKILTRVASVLFGHEHGLINIHTEKHLRYTLTSAILSSAPRPLMWSLKYKAWRRTRRVPMVVKEYLGDWALYQLGTIESLCIRNRSRVMDRFKILQGLKGREMGPPVKGWKKFKRDDGSVVWRGRIVTPEGYTYDSLSGGMVSVNLPIERIMLEAEASKSQIRNHQRAKVITRETVSNPKSPKS